MVCWTALIAILTLTGFLIFYIVLIVVPYWLAYASWYAYRDTLVLRHQRASPCWAMLPLEERRGTERLNSHTHVAYPNAIPAPILVKPPDTGYSFRTLIRWSVS